MRSPQLIEHKGIIKEINEKVIKIDLVDTDECSSCHEKDACCVSERDNKTVEVINTSGDYCVGDSAKVILKQSLAFKALFLGYLLPFLFVIVTLIIASSLIKKEEIAGILSLSVLLLYYLVLYYRRDQLQKKFTFTIKK